MALFFKRQMEDTLYVTHQTRGGVQHVLSTKKMCPWILRGGWVSCHVRKAIPIRGVVDFLTCDPLALIWLILLKY